jgi:hypothetical protein
VIGAPTNGGITRHPEGGGSLFGCCEIQALNLLPDRSIHLELLRAAASAVPTSHYLSKTLLRRNTLSSAKVEKATHNQSKLAATPIGLAQAPGTKALAQLGAKRWADDESRSTSTS